MELLVLSWVCGTRAAFAIHLVFDILKNFAISSRGYDVERSSRGLVREEMTIEFLVDQ